MSALRDLVGRATPGPWAWLGSRKSGMYLATPHGGTRFVMDFVRQGFQGAQPRFQVYTDREGEMWGWNGLMTPATDLAVLEVTYRDDIVGIDHPDARLIALAPELALLVADAKDALAYVGAGNVGHVSDEGLEIVRALLARIEELEGRA